MPIGNGPDYYNGINKDEDEQIKRQDKEEEDRKEEGNENY